jgi:serine protease
MHFRRTCVMGILLFTIFVLAGAASAQPSGRLPDLTVVSTRVENRRVIAVVANRGAAAPTVRATATLFVSERGQAPRTVDAVTPALLPRGTAELSFETVLLPGATYQVMVDSNRVVEEGDEGNNRTRSETVPGGGRPRSRGVTVDRTLHGATHAYRIAPLSDRVPRPVSVARFPGGNLVPFVENELLFTTAKKSEAEAIAARYGGKVVRQIDPPFGAKSGPKPGSTFVLRVNTSMAPKGITGRLEEGFVFSSEQGKNLLSIAMHERNIGNKVGVNLIPQNQGFFEGKTVEAAGGNGLSPDYMQTGGVYDVDVRGAWKALAQAGKTSSKPIRMAIVDNGFDTGRSDFMERDLDVAINVDTGGANTLLCAGTPCPWHGTNVAEAAAGIADDNRGAAGTGAPVVKIVAIEKGGGIDGVFAALARAHAEQAVIVNMSFSGKVERDDGLFSGAWLSVLEELETYTLALNDAGQLLFAGAGNQGENIDAVDEDNDETYWYWPCENQAVRCVGGWYDDATSEVAGTIPALGSNYSIGKGEVVDIWGPWCANVGDTFDNQGATVNKPVCGTSIATPMVAGVAALIWAGNTSLTNHAVWELMNKHAIAAGSIRRVHAYRAVREAIMSAGGNTAPALEIVTPKNGSKLNQAGDQWLFASVYDIEDEKACCSVSWTVNGVPAESGTFSPFTFANATLGPKTITATITDSGGKTVTKTVVATLENNAPIVSITVKPTENPTQGLSYPYRAQVVDDSMLFQIASDTVCPGVTWTSTTDPGVIATGCDALLTFSSPGPRTLTASFTDAYGATGSAQVVANVLASTASQLVASIQWPHNGAEYWAEQQIPLEWTSTGNASSLSAHWTLTEPISGETRPIAVTVSGNQEHFTISDVFPELGFSGMNPKLTLTLQLKGVAGQTSTPVSVNLAKSGFIK